MEIKIDWTAFLTVFGAAIGFSTLIVACFALGVRLLTNAQNVAPKARKGQAKAAQEEALNMVGAYLLFAICLCALGFGIFLVLPWNK